jgi:hypothetical protein
MNEYQQSSEPQQLDPHQKFVSLNVCWIVSDGRLTAKWSADEDVNAG